MLKRRSNTYQFYSLWYDPSGELPHSKRVQHQSINQSYKLIVCVCPLISIVIIILLYYDMFVVILLFGHHHDIAEILLKLALNTIKQTNLSGHQKIWSSEKIKPVAIYKFPREFTSVSMKNFSTIFIIWIKPVVYNLKKIKTDIRLSVILGEFD